MRLTTEVIQYAATTVNPLAERELQLRGKKIPQIENLAVSRDINEAIDLTDNAIRSLSNFPRLIRLRTLLLARNRIDNIDSKSFNSKNLPNLTTLVLANNEIENLWDLTPLQGFCRVVSSEDTPFEEKLPALRVAGKLQFLSLVNNPVTFKQNYRLWVVWLLPCLRVLDFARVTDAERLKAYEMFGTPGDPTAAAAEILGVKPRLFDASHGTAAGIGSAGGSAVSSARKLSEREKSELLKQLEAATSLEEISRIEGLLKGGR